VSDPLGAWVRPILCDVAITDPARLAAAVLVAAATLSSACESIVDGRATCPGCGRSAEPSFLPPRVNPSPSTTLAPSATAAPTTVAPSTSATPPGGVIALPPDSGGYVFIETKSGKTRCQISRSEVGCEAQFANSPIQDGEPANGVKVTADGQFQWVLGNLGDIPAVTLGYQTYQAQGWTIDASTSGTRFTNEATGHGMFVSIEAVNAF
jgi:hypothetical protein